MQNLDKIKLCQEFVLEKLLIRHAGFLLESVQLEGISFKEKWWEHVASVPSVNEASGHNIAHFFSCASLTHFVGAES